MAYLNIMNTRSFISQLTYLFTNIYQKRMKNEARLFSLATIHLITGKGGRGLATSLDKDKFFPVSLFSDICQLITVGRGMISITSMQGEVSHGLWNLSWDCNEGMDFLEKKGI